MQAPSNKALLLKEVEHDNSQDDPTIKYQFTAANLYFNEKAYIDKKRVKHGQDAYTRHKFNQAVSDDIPSNREIPDVRNYR